MKILLRFLGFLFAVGTIVFIVGVILFVLSRGGKEIDAHLRDDAEKPAAVR